MEYKYAEETVVAEGGMDLAYLNEQPPKPQADQSKIIKTADIEFATRDLEKTYTRIRKAIAVQQGQLQSDDTGKSYNTIYHNQAAHKSRAIDHLNKYPDSTQWVLPFNYQNGEAVNAYALRHLARQHKMVDIALLYFNEQKDPTYIQYFENQMQSLKTLSLVPPRN